MNFFLLLSYMRLKTRLKSECMIICNAVAVVTYLNNMKIVRYIKRVQYGFQL